MKTFFWKSSQKLSVWEEILIQRVAENFLGKFGEIRAKILRTPKNLPAPTRMH